MGDFNVELYTEIGTGRQSTFYQPTVTYKGRLKQSIEFVAAKSVDNMRSDEIFHAVEIMHKLDHENIIHFINWYQTESKLFIILEFCPGGSLLELLDRDVCLPESVIRIFASDILDALLYLHRHGYLYQDFSPRNMLLDECGLIKLGDFTRSGFVDKTIDLSNIDFEMLQYLAPELLVDGSIPSYASDLYSLGCLMYHMATGATPFVASNEAELVQMIRESLPQPVTEMSNHFNDLVLSLLKKNPYERPTWKDVVKHPFWKDALTDRLDDVFTKFDPNVLPKQPKFDAGKGKISLEQSVTDLSKSIRISSFSEVPSSQPTPPSTDLSTINQIGELLVTSTLLMPSPLALNANIEKETLTSYEGIAMPISPASIRSTDPEEVERAINKVKVAFAGPDRVNKNPLISYLISQSKIPEIAENISSSSLLPELLQYASSTQHVQLAANFLLLFATCIRFSKAINPKNLTEAATNQLVALVSNPQVPIARKAVTAFGELISYIAHDEGIAIPSYISSILFKAFKSGDEVIRHLTLRTIANVLSSPRCSEILPMDQIEPLLISFQINDSNALMETYAVTIATLYSKSSPSSNEFVVTLVQNLMNRPSTNAQILGIIIAAETKMLPSIKSGVISAFKNGTSELRIKAFLAVCLIYRDNLNDFIEFAPKFFQSLEKLQVEAQRAYDCIIQWSAEISEIIVDEVNKGGEFNLLQIIYQAMQIRQFSQKIWSKSFEKKIQKIVRNNTFNDVKSEVALQIIQCAFCYQICDISLISDLCRALNSQLGIVRFTVVKLVADASMQHPIHASLMQFIESNIMTQVLSLLQDEPIIIDQSLRIILNACIEKESTFSYLVKPNILSFIISSVTTNAAALELMSRIISSNQIPIDTIISARLIPSIISSMENKENYESTIQLLLSALIAIEKNLSEIKGAANKRAFVKSVHSLATMASKMAMVLLDYSEAAQCLCILIKIFTPQSSQQDVLIDSAFHPFSISLSQGCRKPEHAQSLAQVIRMLQWSSEQSNAIKLRLKGAGTLQTAIKKASDYGTDELKQAAMSYQKALRG